MLTVGSLFSGIGGFDLGLERAGMRTVWFCERDEFCQRVLAKHWPGVPVHSDVRALVANADGRGLCESGVRTKQQERAQAFSTGQGDGLVPVPVPYVDVLCGGFPCQDLSYAGKGAGIDGERSGLWSEYARLIRDLRPRYVVVENVSALLARGLGRVLGDLAACGYDAEWDCIPASAVGAPHRRDRIWLVAYPNNSEGEHDGAVDAEVGGAPQPIAYPQGDGRGQGVTDARRSGTGARAGQECRPGDGRQALADAARDATAGSEAAIGTVGERARPGSQPGAVGDADRVAGPATVAGDGGRKPMARPGQVERALGSGRSDGRAGLAEPGLGRTPNGVPEWLDGSWERGIPRVATDVPERVQRLRALGNALVPQIAEWIGQRIVDYEEGRLDVAA